MTERTIGRYRIKSKLGEGSMGIVVLAYDPQVKRDVALKVLHRRLAGDAVIRQRFLREARVIAHLGHSAIVPVYDVAEADGYSYFVMRYMEDGSLLARVQQGPLAPAAISPILKRVGSALDAAHAHGIVHRDVKPDNILFDQYGQAYLSDFGIVRAMEGGTHLTKDGLIGTPAYMSPEQVTGDETVDGASDIYSLGAVLFEMITGELPYEGDTSMQMATQHVLKPVPRLRDRNPDLPRAWEQIIARAMAKKKKDRYPSGAALAAAFAAAESGDSVSAQLLSRRWLVPAAVILLMLLFLAWGASGVLSQRTAAETAQQLSATATANAVAMAATVTADADRLAAALAAEREQLAATATRDAELRTIASATERVQIAATTTADAELVAEATVAAQQAITATALAEANKCKDARNYGYEVVAGPIYDPEIGTWFYQGTAPNQYKVGWTLENTGVCSWQNIRLQPLAGTVIDARPVTLASEAVTFAENTQTEVSLLFTFDEQRQLNQGALPRDWVFVVADSDGEDIALLQSGALTLAYDESWSYVIADRDRDRVGDSVDQCPDTAGDAAYDGCPDSDGDGFGDHVDNCPTAAGTINGCPPVPTPTPQPPPPTATPIRPTPTPTKIPEFTPTPASRS